MQKFQTDFEQLLKQSTIATEYKVLFENTFSDLVLKCTVKEKVITYELLKEQFKEKGIKDVSSVTFVNSFKRIVKDLWNGNIPAKPLLIDVELIYNHLMKEEIKLSCKKTLLHGYLRCLQIVNIDTTPFNKREAAINRLVDTAVAYKQTDKPTTTMADLIKTREELFSIVCAQNKEKTKLTTAPPTKEYLCYIISCLYTMCPPLRAQEWYNTYFAIHDENDKMVTSGGNYLDLKTGILHLTNYKTDQTYGAADKIIPKPLCDILQIYQNKTNSTYVISDQNNKPFSQSTFTKLCWKAFGKQLGPSTIRNIYISEEVHDKQMGGDARKALAKFMGHGLGTQQLTYGKFAAMNKQEAKAD